MKRSMKYGICFLMTNVRWPNSLDFLLDCFLSSLVFFFLFFRLKHRMLCDIQLANGQRERIKSEKPKKSLKLKISSSAELPNRTTERLMDGAKGCS